MLVCPPRTKKYTYNGVGRGMLDGIRKPSTEIYTTPGQRTATDITTVTTSRSFSPDVAVGSSMTVGANTTYSLEGAAFTNAPFNWVEDEQLVLRVTSSGTYSVLGEDPVTVEATLLDDGIVCSTFTVTSPVDPATLTVWTDRDLFSDQSLFTD